jgi:CubicO group peptidase (beta-lactamase class C family)
MFGRSAPSLPPNHHRSVSFNEQELDRSVSSLLRSHDQVPGLSLTVIDNFQALPLSYGFANTTTNEKMTNDHFLQCASLSKTIATAFAIEYFTAHGISMTTSANSWLEAYGSSWKITVKPGSSLSQDDANAVTLAMLVNHTALGMHYVYGIPLNKYIPTPEQLLSGEFSTQYRYESLFLERIPGKSFSYSGGGYVVLQHLIELMEHGANITNITRSFLDSVGLQDFTFEQLYGPLNAKYASGHLSLEKQVFPSLAFPPFAAGGLCPSSALAHFLIHLAKAFHQKEGSGGISHFTSRLMLDDRNSIDLGCMNFMGAKMGLGVFIAKAGNNSIMLHQAANDGFRGVYMLCYDGKDIGKGFVILTNGDNPAVLFQSELCRLLLGPQGKNLTFRVAFPFFFCLFFYL